MGIQSKKNIQKVIQKFHDGAFQDEELQKLMEEFHEAEKFSGIRDELILERIFTYLDNKLQSEIRATLKQEKV